MYNLLVASKAGDWNRQGFDWSADRFLTMTAQYTVSAVTELGGTLQDGLMRLPMLLAYEAQLELPARVAWIKRLVLRGTFVECHFQRVNGINPIPPEGLNKMLTDLGIDRSEMHIRHWAIKDADLPQVLLKHKRITGSHTEHRNFRVRAIELSRPAAARPPSPPQAAVEQRTPPGKSVNLSDIMAASRPVKNAPKPRIFIVHGHDDELLAQVARFIEKMGMEAVILHEQPNSGHTIISKFKEHAGKVDYAVVLMTPDDVGRSKSEKKSQPRARQNVIFELGFFFAQLEGKRVAALVKGKVEKPSDFDGVLYISTDAADWKTKLIKEFQAAGIEGDYVKGI